MCNLCQKIKIDLFAFCLLELLCPIKKSFLQRKYYVNVHTEQKKIQNMYINTQKQFYLFLLSGA